MRSMVQPTATVSIAFFEILENANFGIEMEIEGQNPDFQEQH